MSMCMSNSLPCKARAFTQAPALVISTPIQVVQIATDTVGADATLYEAWFNDGTAWPSQSADLTGLENGSNTDNISIYLETSIGAGAAARFAAFNRMMEKNN